MIWGIIQVVLPRACSPLLLSSVPSYRCIPASHFSFTYDAEGAVVRAQVGKEFPDMRQNEREIKFIRVGDTVRTAGQLKRELILNRVLSPLLYPEYKEWDSGLAGHLLIG